MNFLFMGKINYMYN